MKNALNPPFHRRHRSDPHWSAWERYQQIKRNNEVNVAQADAPQTSTSGPPTIPVPTHADR